MARHKDHSKALELRKQGKSYTEIKSILGVGKGTLSAWLREHPLPAEDLVRLRDRSPLRIEKCRATKQAKRQTRLDQVYERVKKDLQRQTDRTLLVAGFYLYWAEGGKTKPYTVMMANTDYTMLVCFLDWLELLGWERTKVKVRIQLYADMDIDHGQQYWQKALGLPEACFQRPYIKKTNRADLSYKGGFCHGTCNVIVDNRDLAEYVLMGIKYLREKYSTQH